MENSSERDSRLDAVLTRLYGTDGADGSRMLICHVGYLLGWSPEDVVQRHRDLFATHITVGEVTEAWTRVACRPATALIRSDKTVMPILAQLPRLLLTAARTAGWNPRDDDRTWESLIVACAGMGIEPVAEDFPLVPPDVLVDVLWSQPGLLVFDLADFDEARRTHRRKMSASQALARGVVHANGWMPTIELYESREDLRTMNQCLMQGIEPLALSHVVDDVAYVGYLLRDDEPPLTRLVPLSGSGGRQFLAMAAILGVARMEVYDADDPALPLAFTRPLYFAHLRGAAREDVETLVEAAGRQIDDFGLLDRTRHSDAYGVSRILRDTFGHREDDPEAVAEYDRLLRSYYDEVAFGSDPRAPMPPIHLLPTFDTRTLANPFAETDAIVHFSYDRLHSVCEFIGRSGGQQWDGAVHAPEHLGLLVDEFEQCRRDGLATTDDGDAALTAVLGPLMTMAEATAKQLRATGMSDGIRQVWYTADNALERVPWGACLEEALAVPCVRTPSMTLGILVDNAVGPLPHRGSNLTDIFLCNPVVGNPHHLDSAEAECATIAGMNPNSEMRATPDDLLNSVADVIHVSAHGDGDATSFTNRLRLGEAGDEHVSALDILASPRPITADLVFLDCCTAGSADHSRTARHEDLSVADALVLAGTQYVVASGWPIGDTSGAAYSIVFHWLLHQGYPDPPRALRATQKYFRGETDQGTALELDELLARSLPRFDAHARREAAKWANVLAFEIHGRPARREPAPSTDYEYEAAIIADSVRKAAHRQHSNLEP